MRGNYWWLLFSLAFLLLVIVAGYRYEQYVMARNFTFFANTACDSSLHDCFIADCSPEEDGLGCPNGPYAKVELSASDAPKCLSEHSCKSFSCDGLEDCEITYCSEDILDEGEICSSDGVNKEQEENGFSEVVEYEE